MDIWGTRPEGNTERSGKPWTIKEFAFAVHADSLKPGSAERNVGNWRDEDEGPPRNRTTIQKIEAALFGDNPAFDNWKNDLRSALVRSRESGKNRGTRHGSAPDIGREDLIDYRAGLTDDAGAQRAALALLASRLGVRRELLEVLALRFGHESPDDSDETLELFLKSRAREYTELKSRIEQLEDDENRLANLLGASTDALEAGNFVEAEEMLRVAEEQQLENHTLKAVRTQASIRVVRGEAALLSGDIPSAKSHFEKAMTFLHGFSTDEEFYLRGDLSWKILQRSPYGEFDDLAFDLVEPTLGYYPEGSRECGTAQLWAGRCYCHSDYWLHGRRRESARRARIALQHFSAALNQGDECLPNSVAIDVSAFSAMAHLMIVREGMVDRDYLIATCHSTEAIKSAELAITLFNIDDNPKLWVKCHELIINAVNSVGSDIIPELLDERIALFDHAVDRLMANRGSSSIQIYSLELSGEYLRFVKLATPVSSAIQRARIYNRMAEIFEFTKDVFALDEEDEQSRSFLTEELEEDFFKWKLRLPIGIHES